MAGLCPSLPVSSLFRVLWAFPRHLLYDKGACRPKRGYAPEGEMKR
jgi:hypothetical protein